jgi:hypothetical protein
MNFRDLCVSTAAIVLSHAAAFWLGTVCSGHQRRCISNGHFRRKHRRMHRLTRESASVQNFHSNPRLTSEN